jgi:hypothetical protein
VPINLSIQDVWKGPTIDTHDDASPRIAESSPEPDILFCAKSL